MPGRMVLAAVAPVDVAFHCKRETFESAERSIAHTDRGVVGEGRPLIAGKECLQVLRTGSQQGADLNVPIHVERMQVGPQP